MKFATGILMLPLIMSPVAAFGFDGYDAHRCTAIVGNKVVALDPTLDGGLGCIDSNSDSRFVIVKVGGVKNIYDKHLRKMLLRKNIGSDFSVVGVGANIALVEIGGGNKYAIVHIDTGRIGKITYDGNLAGPYSGNDVIVSNSSIGACNFYKYESGRLKYVAKSSFTPCGVWGPGAYGVPIVNSVVLYNNVTMEKYSYNFSESMYGNFAGVDHRALSDSRRAKCEHLYVGRRFEGRGGVFAIKKEYEIVGFSSSTSKATIRSGSYHQEVSCSQIPE